MVIYLQHDKHGLMPVYSEAEAAVHAKAGWRKYTFPVAPVAPVQTDEANEVVAPRRGRPPKER